MIDGAAILIERLAPLAPGRIFDKVFPPGAFTLDGSDLAAITVDKISSARPQTHGPSPGVSLPRYQVTCWHTDKSVAFALAAQVDATLEPYRTGFSTSVDGVFVDVQTVVVEDDPPEIFEPDTQLFQIPLSVRMALAAA